jgi:hypothetical protein
MHFTARTWAGALAGLRMGAACNSGVSLQRQMNSLRRTLYIAYRNMSQEKKDEKERRDQNGTHDPICDDQSAHVPASVCDHESFLDRHR